MSSWQSLRKPAEGVAEDTACSNAGKQQDPCIESASGSTVTIKLTDGSTASHKYDEAAHAWDGQIWVVVLPQ